MIHQIKLTQDYNKFKYFEENRELEAGLVNKLYDSLKKKNLLNFNPILVDENYYIIDGQHRLSAAERLGCDVYYMVIPEADTNDIILLNQNQKPWVLAYYSRYHATRGKSDYIAFEEFRDIYHLTARAALELFNDFSEGSLGPKRRKDFIDGAFCLPDLKNVARAEEALTKGRRVIEYIHTKLAIPMGSLNTEALVRSLAFIFTIHAVKLGDFMKQLEMGLSRFRRCVCVEDYVELFEEIINFRKSYKLELRHFYNEHKLTCKRKAA